MFNHYSLCYYYELLRISTIFLKRKPELGEAMAEKQSCSWGTDPRRGIVVVAPSQRTQHPLTWAPLDLGF